LLFVFFFFFWVFFFFEYGLSIPWLWFENLLFPRRGWGSKYGDLRKGAIFQPYDPSFLLHCTYNIYETFLLVGVSFPGAYDDGGAQMARWNPTMKSSWNLLRPAQYARRGWVRQLISTDVTSWMNLTTNFSTIALKSGYSVWYRH